MRLVSLKIHNIRSYVDEEITFPEGTMLLSGDIGAGKTTILLSTEFALFGTKRGVISAQSLLRNGAKEGWVELTFTSSGKHIVIRRVLKRTKESIKQDAGYIEIDGVREDATAQELKSRVFSLIGYPQNLVGKGDDLVYRFTVFTPQEQMKEILLCEPQKRLDILRRVFGIDKYKRIRENVSMYTKELRSRVRELQGSLTDYDEKKKQFTDKGRRVVELAEEKRVLDDKMKLSLARFVEKKDALAQLDKEYEQFVQLTTEVKAAEARSKELVVKGSDLQSTIENTRARQKEIQVKCDAIVIPQNIPPVARLKEEIEQFEKKIKEVRMQCDDLKNKRIALIAEKANIEKATAGMIEEEKEYLQIAEKVRKIQENLAKRALIKERKQQAEGLLKDAHEKKVTSEVSITNSDKVIAKLADLSSCPMCEQDVPHDHKKSIVGRETENKQSHTKILESVHSQIETAQAKVQDMEQKIQILHEQEKKLAGFTSWIDQYEERKKSHLTQKKRLTLIDTEVSQIMAREREVNVAELEERLTQKRSMLTSAQELSTKAKEKELYLAQLTEKNKEIETALGKVKENKQAHTQLLEQITELIAKETTMQERMKVREGVRKELDVAQNEHKQHEVALARCETEYTELRKAVRLLQDELDKKKDAHTKVTQSKALSHWCDELLIKLCATLEKHVMGRINQEFNELFKEWFEVLVGDDIISVQIDDEFTPLVVQNGHEQTIDNLSGGEKTAVALAYRLALNKVINDLIENIKTSDILILDEPTDGFSSSQLDKVRDVLEQLGTKQTILVSHDPKVESFVESIVRITKSDHISRIL